MSDTPAGYGDWDDRASLSGAESSAGRGTANAIEGTDSEAHEYRRLTALRREATPANHKRVYRLYQEKGLAMRILHLRRIRWHGAVTSRAATRPNQRCSMNFVSDCVSTGM